MQANDKKTLKITSDEKEKKEDFSPKELRPTAQRLQKRSERHMVRIKPYPKTHKVEESKTKTRKNSEKSNAATKGEKSETAETVETATTVEGAEPAEKAETIVSDEAADKAVAAGKNESTEKDKTAGKDKPTKEDEGSKKDEDMGKDGAAEKGEAGNKSGAAEKSETAEKDKKTTSPKGTTAKIAVVSPIPTGPKKNDAPPMTRRGATAAGRRPSVQIIEMEDEATE